MRPGCPSMGGHSRGCQEACSTSQPQLSCLNLLHRPASRHEHTFAAAPIRRKRKLCLAARLEADKATATSQREMSTIPRPKYGDTAIAHPPQHKEQDEILIELRDVHKSFGSKKILQGVNITIRRGEAVGIIGGSGTGKSTTLRLMAGLLAPDKGEIRIKGQTRHGLLADDPALAEQLKLGMVFQNGALFDSLSVGENVGFMLYEHTRMSPPRVEVRVAEALGSVGLSGVERLLPSELSGGMRKRVALARAIVKEDLHEDDEQVIMYDEPTAGLDPVASTVVEDLMRSMHDSPDMYSNGSAPSARSGITSYIVVTHQHSTIRRAVDRLIFLHEGSVVWEGTVAEFDTCEVPIVRQFASGSLDGPIRYE